LNVIDPALIQQLGPKTQAKVDPFLQRWAVFSGKVTQRSQDVAAEADRGLDEIVAQNPTDGGPIAGAFSAVRARYLSIGRKVDQAVDKLDEEWEEALSGVGGKDGERVYTLFCQIRQEAAALRVELETTAEWLQARKGADWGRQLYQAAAKEWSQQLYCPQCGAPLPVVPQYHAVTEPCESCGSVTELSPGPAAAYYFGSGVHHLAQEASFPQWQAMQAAQQEHDALTNPSQQDRDRFVGVVRAYWTAYYQTFIQLNPTYNRTLEQAVEAKLTHLTTNVWDQGRGEADRAAISEALAIVATGNQRAMYDFVKSHPGLWIGGMVDDAYRKGDLRTVEFLLAMEYEEVKSGRVITITNEGIFVGTDDSFAKWKKKRFKELETEQARK
jgi:hypothetical protein